MNVPDTFSLSIDHEYTKPVFINGLCVVAPHLYCTGVTLYATSDELNNAVSALGIQPIPKGERHTISKTLRAMADIAEFIEKERARPTASKMPENPP